MAVELCVAQEGIWFDQNKYEEAEARYQEIVADRHAGLRVEGKAIQQETSASRLASEIEKAKSFIKQSLETAPLSKGSGFGSGELEQRVSQLEKENVQLRSCLGQMENRLGRLETTVSKLFLSIGALSDPKSQGNKAKSDLLLEIKPWDDETDVQEMEKLVRSVEADGLRWGASKLVPVAYGIKKLQIRCIIEDDKIGTDFLEEQITAFKDYVQSMDIVAFNKF